MTEYEEKKAFVSNYLSPLISAAGVNIAKAEYTKSNKTSEETVTIFYLNGFKRTVCVTADSLIALTADTLKEI